MNEMKTDCPAILVVGNDKLAYSVACNALAAGQDTTLVTTAPTAAQMYVQRNLSIQAGNLQLQIQLPDVIAHRLVVVVTNDTVSEKQDIIHQLETRVAADTIIAINTESIPLDELQANSRHPGRIIGLNWTYPAHKTFFSEIISNSHTGPAHVRDLATLAKEKWDKRPYTVQSGFSIRGRLFAALVREALYLVAHGYATVAGIDRACRNDAGYYLPFAGNFRYMDLMGTHAYGLVMKDLNPELSKASDLPAFFENLIQSGKRGMHTGDGFYHYEEDDEARWEEIYCAYSDEIKALMLTHNHEEPTDY